MSDLNRRHKAAKTRRALNPSSDSRFRGVIQDSGDVGGRSLGSQVGSRRRGAGRPTSLSPLPRPRPSENFLGDGEKGNPGRKLGAFRVQADGEIVKLRGPK